MATTTTEISKEYYKTRQEYHKNYYHANKDKWTKYNRNPVSKEKRAEWNKKYNQKAGKVKCTCGFEVHKNYVSRHIKTKKHIKLEEAKAIEGEEILWTPKC